MSETVGDQLLGRLAGEWGVKRIYGYPGDGINGVMGSFDVTGRGPSSSRSATRRWPP
jgi:pyruvate dehydrogenase (quinone)